jgi:N-acetylglucosamine-6-phosphate deacetylase
MTFAPELPGIDEVVPVLVENGVVPAVGHTAADATAVEGLLRRLPRSLVTHVFNGMPPLHHRAPGPALGALVAAAAGATRLEVIADGVHVDDRVTAALFALVGAANLVLVTDAMAAAGMPDGEYDLGPQRVRVQDGIARLAGGGSIAGGTTRLLDIVRRQVGAGLDPVAVVGAASAGPAAALGLDSVGALRPGMRADVVVADDAWRPLRVMVAGEWLG